MANHIWVGRPVSPRQPILRFISFGPSDPPKVQTYSPIQSLETQSSFFKKSKFYHYTCKRDSMHEFTWVVSKKKKKIARIYLSIISQLTFLQP